ncbi:MAG: VTT domain-containing protein [Dokdonella sp.]
MPSRLKRVLPLLLLVAAGVVVLASGWLDRLRPEALVATHAELQKQVEYHRLQAGLIHVFSLAVMVATAMPGALLLVLAGGLLFGTVAGTLQSLVGVCLGAILLFFASRRAFEGGTRPAPALVERIRERYHAHPWSYTMFLRLVPVLPFGAVTVALAWLRCPLRLFLVTTLVGSIAMLSLQSMIGANLVELFARDGGWSPRSLLSPGILLPSVALALLALTPLLVERLRRRAT